MFDLVDTSLWYLRLHWWSVLCSSGWTAAAAGWIELAWTDAAAVAGGHRATGRQPDVIRSRTGCWRHPCSGCGVCFLRTHWTGVSVFAIDPLENRPHPGTPVAAAGAVAAECSLRRSASGCHLGIGLLEKVDVKLVFKILWHLNSTWITSFSSTKLCSGIQTLSSQCFF